MRAVFLNSGGGGKVRPSASRASIVASGIAPPSSLAARGSGYLRHGSHHRARNPDRGLSPPPVSLSVQAHAASRPIDRGGTFMGAPVVWFEVADRDFDTLSKFYTEIFHWR